MPDITSVDKFVKSLQTGRTDTTKALDLLSQQNLRADAADWDLLQTPRSLDRPTSPNAPRGVAVGWWKKYLEQPAQQPPPLPSQALKTAELDHIDDWPDEQKEKVRETLVFAQLNKRKIHFFWELYRGEYEATEIVNPDPDTGPGADITVTFRTPGSKVTLVGPNNVRVDV